MHTALLVLSLLATACQPLNQTNKATTPTKAPASAPAAGTVAVTADSPAAPAAETVVASWTGGKLTYGELEKTVKGRLARTEIDYLNERYSILSSAIDDSVNKTLLDAEAKKRGLADGDALLKAEVEDKYKELPEADIQAFYTENQRRFRNKPLEEIRDQVVQRALADKKQKATTELIERLRKTAGVEISLAQPALPRLDVSPGDGAIRGNPNAPIMIVEFADYQCPYCERGYTTMKEVMSTYGDKVAWSYRNFPLSFHPRAMPASVASWCAGQQGKFWEMHDKIFENQKGLEDENLKQHATDIGLNMAKWEDCRTSKAATDAIIKDQADGQSLGMGGTPAYFINGVMLSGARPIDAFKEAIDKELVAKGVK